jgi:DNA-binding helix-hairpin-helix protein with protein kinase domain
VLRRKQLEAVPLTAADDVPSDDALPDRRLEQRQQAAAMTLTLVVVGLVLAPPTGWLLGAWLADLTYETP